VSDNANRVPTQEDWERLSKLENELRTELVLAATHQGLFGENQRWRLIKARTFARVLHEQLERVIEDLDQSTIG